MAYADRREGRMASSSADLEEESFVTRPEGRVTSLLHAPLKGAIRTFSFVLGSVPTLKLPAVLLSVEEEGNEEEGRESPLIYSIRT